MVDNVDNVDVWFEEYDRRILNNHWEKILTSEKVKGYFTKSEFDHLISIYFKERPNLSFYFLRENDDLEKESFLFNAYIMKNWFEDQKTNASRKKFFCQGSVFKYLKSHLISFIQQTEKRSKTENSTESEEKVYNYIEIKNKFDAINCNRIWDILVDKNKKELDKFSFFLASKDDLTKFMAYGKTRFLLKQ